MVRLQYNNKLDFTDYQQDNDLWIALQDYQNADWNITIQMWKYYNLHMIQVIKSVDHTKLENLWQNFEGITVTYEKERRQDDGLRLTASFVPACPAIQ